MTKLTLLGVSLFVTIVLCAQGAQDCIFSDGGEKWYCPAGFSSMEGHPPRDNIVKSFLPTEDASPRQDREDIEAKRS